MDETFILPPTQSLCPNDGCVMEPTVFGFSCDYCGASLACSPAQVEEMREECPAPLTPALAAEGPSSQQEPPVAQPVKPRRKGRM